MLYIPREIASSSLPSVHTYCPFFPGGYINTHFTIDCSSTGKLAIVSRIWSNRSVRNVPIYIKSIGIQSLTFEKHALDKNIECKTATVTARYNEEHFQNVAPRIHQTDKSYAQIRQASRHWLFHQVVRKWAKGL